MGAVFKHELKIYFHSLTAYIFGAFLLAFTGVGVMICNIQDSITNFEYVLDFCSIIFVIIVPILTMRVIAEERRQKTDQLLYSLPISTTNVVLGKYLALLMVYVVPLVIVSVYPLLFTKYGEVYMLSAYGSLIAFFILGAALIAVGIFISSLSENQGFVAGIGIALILFNYLSVSLSEYVSATPSSSLIALCVLSAILGVIISHITKNDYFGYGIGAALMVGFIATYFVNEGKLEGLLPNIMAKLSLFEQFNAFVNGVFDMTAIVYFLSVIVFFLFLSVQSLEKRRYN